MRGKWELILSLAFSERTERTMDSGEVVYLLIRNSNCDNEPLGLAVIKDGRAYNVNTFTALDIQIDCDLWWPDLITRSEYETYLAFGFKEYKI